MLKTTLRGLLAHKLRLALTALAVVLGVGFIAGTYVLTDTMNKTFDELFSQTTEGLDVFVRSERFFESLMGEEDRKPIPEAIEAEVASVEGVEEAQGSVTGYAQIVDKKGEAISPTGPPTLGISWTDEEQVVLKIRSGKPPEAPGEVVIDAGTAEDAGFEVGDAVTILLPIGPEEFTLVGITGFGDADNLAGATLSLFEPETAQRVLDKEGEFDSIEVTAEEGVSPSELARHIQTILPDGIEAATASEVADEQADSIKKGLSFFNIALLVFAGVALFVGAFIIFNTFSIVVAQRTKEFALLRALGATGRQVMTSVIVEALLVGVLASIVGIAAGAAIAVGLQNLLGAFGLDLPSTTLQLAPRTIIVSLLVGTGVTVVSSIVPARKAARVSPMEALRASEPRPYHASGKRSLIGAAVTALGIGILLYGLFGAEKNAINYVGAGAWLTMLGVAVLGPVFSGPLARIVGAPMPRMLRVPGHLARENASRNPKRTAATAAALMIGLTLVTFTTVFGASLKASADTLIDEAVAADFVISNTSFGGSVRFSPQIARRLAEQETLGTVSPMRFGEFRFEGGTRFVTGIDPGTFTDVLDVGTGGEAAEVKGLADGEVMIHDVLARDLDLGPGDPITLEFQATGKQRFKVRGTYSRKDVAGEFLITMSSYRENFGTDLDDMVMFDAAPGASIAEARSEAEAVLEEFPNVELQNQAEFKEQASGQIDQLLGLVTALLGLALVIALLGITNTLALSVFERTREIGLLRAVGMARRQTRSMIRWEAVIIAVIGALLGLVVGSFFGWALVRALKSEGITELVFPGGQLVIYIVAAALAGVLAALPPARRAARLNVLEAITHE